MEIGDLLAKIPEHILSRSHKELKEIVEEIKRKAKIKKIDEEMDSEKKVVFTDGSNVISERRGCGVSIFSSISIKYHVDNSGYRIEDTVYLGPEKTLLILLPRFNLVSRSNSIMRGLEYLTALSLAREDTDIIVFDGSYVTSLLEPKIAVRDIYLDIRSILRKSHGDEFNKIMFEMVLLLDEELEERIVKKMDLSNPLAFADWFFMNYYKVFEKIHDRLMEEASHRPKEPIISKLQNYIFLLIEQTFTATALSGLLNYSLENDITLVWIGKDTESRIITKNFKSISLSNDSVLMDYMLEPKTYMRVSNVAEISEISVDEFTISEEGDINYANRSFNIPIKLVHKIYVNFSDYEVVYSKLGGRESPTIQLTYPQRLMKINNKDMLSDVLKTLLKTSKYGYPEPLRVVHQRSILRERSIEIISDGLYRMCKEKASIICALLRDSGRELLI